jgi:CubicO group peptidase (beta-lactamase class C family)
MGDTGFFVPQEKLDRFAALYSPPDDDGFRLLDAPTASPFSRPDRPPSGGVGLVSTTADYFRFAQMMLNGGSLNGARLLRRETVEMMTKNQLPDDLLPIAFGASQRQGMGYGLGFGVHIGQVQNEILGSEGTYNWSGHGRTHFWVDPKEELVGLIMTQALDYYDDLHDTLRKLALKAVVVDNAKPSCSK